MTISLSMRALTSTALLLGACSQAVQLREGDDRDADAESRDEPAVTTQPAAGETDGASTSTDGTTTDDGGDDGDDSPSDGGTGPEPTTGLPGYRSTTTLHALKTGVRHTCVQVGDGVKCWGDNMFGSFGDGTTTASSTPTWTLPLGSGVTSISQGGDHTCAVIGGGVKCWGVNNRGQLGFASTDFIETSPVTLFPAGSGIAQVSTGYSHSCVVKNGGVACWGEQDKGAVGSGQPAPGQAQVLQPTFVIAEGSDATYVSAGYLKTCAVVKGGLWCWGWNNYEGVIGIGQRATADNPDALYIWSPAQVLPAGSGVTKVAVGHANICAIVRSGLACWGTQEQAAVGDGVVASGFGTGRDVPTSVIAEGSDVTDVDVGNHFACAVVKGGLKCWGDNNYAQLGVAPPSTLPYSATHRDVFPAGSGVVEIAAERWFACARFATEQVSCWGTNELGELGYGHPLDLHVPGPSIDLDAQAAADAKIAFSRSAFRIYADESADGLTLLPTLDSRAFWIRNLGGKHLRIDGITAPAGFSVERFGNMERPPQLAVSPNLPYELAPGEVWYFMLHSDPAVPSPKAGELQITSSDPATPVLKVQVAH